jgi:hypothetical protein
VEAPRTKGLRIATRCANVAEFVATFYRQCGDRSFFIATASLRPVGFETAFSLDLVDKSPALRGFAVVQEAWPTADNPFGRPGMQFGIRKLTTTSEKVFEQLRAARGVPLPQEVDVNTDVTSLPVGGERTPGSELVLPANPLSGIPDSSLSGFIECTLYEETGTFFPVEPEAAETPPDEPPLLAPLVPRARSPVVDGEPEPAEPTEVEPRRSTATPPPLPTVTPPPVPVVRIGAPTPRPFPVPTPHPVPVPVPTPPPAPVPAPVTAAPTPPRPAFVFAPPPRPPRRWLVPAIVAASAALVAIIIVIVVVAGGSSSADDPPAKPTAKSPSPPSPSDPPPPSQPPSQSHEVQPPPSAGSDRNATVDPPEEPRDPNAPPQIGSGPCKLVVTSTPAGSTVSLDGEAVGPTPIAIAGPCQHRKVDIAHARYATATRTVALAGGGAPTTIDVALQRPQHRVLVETQPAGATVSIAGRTAGQSPTWIMVLGFTTMDIAISKPGYLPVTKHLYSRVPSDRVVVRLVKSMTR